MNEKKLDRYSEEAEEARLARARQDELDSIERENLQYRIVQLMVKRDDARERGDETQASILAEEIRKLRQEKRNRFGY